MPGAEMTTPRVSIVTSTYNRSNVLRFTIESVLASTVADWEMIIVGDACTDDTAHVVASFGDSRISFVNLPVNSGEQATPNNEGVRRARGEYVAFLNHDDLWTPDHLATCLDAIGEGDFVSTLTLVIDHHDVAHLAGVTKNREYAPELFVPASSWMLRRTFADQVGPWRPARELFFAPSQEWLFRAWKQGHRLPSVAKTTVIAVFSGQRKHAYAERHEAEQARYLELLRSDPLFLQRMLEEVASRLTLEVNAATPLRHFNRAVKALVRRATLSAGVHPHSLRNAVLFRRRGAFLDSLRRNRGLTPLPRRRTT